MLYASSRGPSQAGSSGIPFSPDDCSRLNKDLTRAFYRQMAKNHEIRAFRSGKPIKPYSDEEIEKRAFSDPDAKGSESDRGGAYLNETDAELCEMRGLDGGTDTSIVGTDYMHEFYRNLLLGGKLVPCFRNQIDVPQGMQALTVPIIGDAQFLLSGAITTDAYTVGDAADPSSSTFTLTPKKLTAIIFLNDNLTEDSLAPIVDGLKESMIRGAVRAQEHVILNGDTTAATTNINAYNCTALGTKDPRLLAKGLRALNYWGTDGGSSTGAMYGVNVNAVASLDMIGTAVGALNAWGVDDENDNLVTVVPACSSSRLLLDTKARPDTYSPLVEVQGGRLTRVANTKLVKVGNSLFTNASSSEVPTYALQMSEGLPINLDANGVYASTGNAKTTFVTFHQGNFAIGRKRAFSFKVVELPLGGQFALVGTMRFDFQRIHANEAIAVGYNVTQ